VGAKIRDAELCKIPLMIIVGEKEENNKTISLRRKFKGDLGSMKIDAFLSQIDTEIKNKGVKQ
jgi:threonyl-tRNA synthetase